MEVVTVKKEYINKKSRNLKNISKKEEVKTCRN
ncbi:hypothetical protein ES703_24475 [subsurface metagenome]